MALGLCPASLLTCIRLRHARTRAQCIAWGAAGWRRGAALRCGVPDAAFACSSAARLRPAPPQFTYSFKSFIQPQFINVFNLFIPPQLQVARQRLLFAIREGQGSFDLS